MKLDITKPAKTRDGRTAQHLATINHPVYPKIWVVTNEDGTQKALNYTADGRFVRNQKNNADLIQPQAKHKLTGWLNVYPDGCCLSTTRKADDFAGPNRIACLDLSQYNIEFEEGEGL